MIKNLTILFGMICLGFGVYGVMSQHHAPIGPVGKVVVADTAIPTDSEYALLGQTVPDFKVSKKSVAEFRGKTVLINFWATWCAPCLAEMPSLLSFIEQNEDLVLIGVSSDISEEKMNTYLNTLNSNAKDLFDKRVFFMKDNRGRITRDLFGTVQLPETLIISPEGLITKKIIGAIEWNEKALTP